VRVAVERRVDFGQLQFVGDRQRLRNQLHAADHGLALTRAIAIEYRRDAENAADGIVATLRERLIGLRQ
jgi:hypothetical protein